MSIFNSVSIKVPKRNLFPLSHEVRFTAKFGQLLPMCCFEVVPGDTFQISTEHLTRAMAMVAPLMHRVNVYTHFFFVPNRLVWDEWREFITGGVDGTANPPFPQVLVQTREVGHLADFLGVGCFKESNAPARATYVSALPFRAYNLIFNEYYRDQNLQDEVPIDKGGGIDTTTNLGLLTRNWEKDYFTSALPWTQRGPESYIPIDGESEVLYSGNGNAQVLRAPFGTVPDSTGILPGRLESVNRNNQSNLQLLNSGNGGTDPVVNLDPNGTMKVNYDDALLSVNNLRRSLAFQRFMETSARGGSRYIEQMQSFFGVKSSDARLQRPEFLGGGISPLQISEVIQTSSSTATSDLGDMAGHGIAVGSSKQFRKFFEEHGFVIGIFSIMPKTSYAQGTKRFFHKFDRFDYYWPTFAHLGEQEIWNSEIYQDSSLHSGPASGTFGYQSRYAEYKYFPNTVHGDLKTPGFENWTLYRKFAEPPVLNSEFIEADSDAEDLGRIFPVSEGPNGQFVVQLFHSIKAIRPMPKHSIPGL